MIETRLHILLAEKRMTQKDLSEAIGIGRNTISRYYNNTWTQINKDDISKLCAFFNCKVEDIFYYIDDDSISLKKLDSIQKSIDALRPITNDCHTK